MSAPWLETWISHSIDAVSGWHGTSVFSLTAKTGHNDITISTRAIGEIDPKPWALLAIAAPEMCRALLSVEYIDCEHIDLLCPRCGCKQPGHAKAGEFMGPCILDAALTKAGLDTQEKRDAARAKMKEMGL